MSHNIPFDNGFVWNALKVRTAFRINIRYEFFRADRSVVPHFSQRPRFPFTVMTRQTGFPPVDSQRASKSCLLPSRSLCPSLFFLEKKKSRKGIAVEKEKREERARSNKQLGRKDGGTTPGPFSFHPHKARSRCTDSMTKGSDDTSTVGERSRADQLVATPIILARDARTD